MTATEPPDVDRQIRALTEIIGTLAAAISRLSGRVDQLSGDARPQESDDENKPAPWVWISPESVADDDSHVIVDRFVEFYNSVYVGVGGHAGPIPLCWQDHPGLAAEVATLAYTWRAANLGTTANAREAQYWLHQWRVGFADRLARDWVHSDCLDGAHVTETGR